MRCLCCYSEFLLSTLLYVTYNYTTLCQICQFRASNGDYKDILKDDFLYSYRLEKIADIVKSHMKNNEKEH